MRGFKTLLVLGLGLLMIGCTNSNETARNTRLAAYASSTPYPTTRASDDLRVAAIVNRHEGTIRLINFSNRTLSDANVWVNGSFVRKVTSLPASGSVTLSTASMYDSSGRSMAAQKTNPVTIQLQTDDGLYNLLGPAFE